MVACKPGPNGESLARGRICRVYSSIDHWYHRQMPRVPRVDVAEPRSNTPYRILLTRNEQVEADNMFYKNHMIWHMFDRADRWYNGFEITGIHKPDLAECHGRLLVLDLRPGQVPHNLHQRWDAGNGRSESCVRSRSQHLH